MAERWSQCCGSQLPLSRNPLRFLIFILSFYLQWPWVELAKFKWIELRLRFMAPSYFWFSVFSGIFNERPPGGGEWRCGNHRAKCRRHPAGFPYHRGGSRQKIGTENRKMGCLGSGFSFCRNKCWSGCCSVFTCTFHVLQLNSLHVPFFYIAVLYYFNQVITQWCVSLYTMSCDKKGKITALWKIEEHEVFVEEFVVIFVVISHIFFSHICKISHIQGHIFFCIICSPVSTKQKYSTNSNIVKYYN